MQLFATVAGLVVLFPMCVILKITPEKNRLPALVNLQRRNGSRLLISSAYRHVTTNREWLERTLSLRLLLLPILSRWLPSRQLRAPLSPPPNERRGRNRD